LKKRQLIIIIIVNAFILALLGNYGPANMREALGLYAMANIADHQQVVLPEGFGNYPDAIRVSEGKYLAPQPLWQQIGGSICYKVSKVFFGVEANYEGLRKFYHITSFLGNFIASTILILIFAQALSVKALKSNEILLMLIPMIFFSLILTSGMIMESYLWVATLCFWALHLVNGGVYLINRDMPFRKSFLFSGIVLAFAACLSLPALGIGIGFLAKFIIQRENKFKRAALDIFIGMLIPFALTILIVSVYSKSAGVIIPPWPETVSSNGATLDEAARYLYYCTFGFNGIFIYSPLVLMGAFSLLRRYLHFQKLVESGKRLDHYALGQSLIVSSVILGAIVSFVLFLLQALMNGTPEKASLQEMYFWMISLSKGIPTAVNPELLPANNINLGGDTIWLPSLTNSFGSMVFLFLIPLFHYFNLHIFREKPFEKLKIYYHEVVRIGGLFAVVSLALPQGGYLVPFVWAVHKISVWISGHYPTGNPFWQ
jgi:hypothetical protein